MRFYKNLEDHNDVTNPQNNQTFGRISAYPLEVGEWHRFLIPMYDNELAEGEYEVHIVNSDRRKKIQSSLYIKDGLLRHISFRANEEIEGRLEVVEKNTGIPQFYSNRVQFMDSTNALGRKFIRIATRHSYSKNGFDFDDENDWIITNIPAYCLGMTEVDAEIVNSRVGGNSALMIKDSYTDEIVSYQVEAEGDANILNFVQVCATNDYFFIDGVQKTLLEKIDRDEFAMYGTVRFASVKDANGGNIALDEQEIFDDLALKVVTLSPKHQLSVRKNHFTENEISIRFNHFFTLTQELNAKIRVYKDGALWLDKNAQQVETLGYSLIINKGELEVGQYKVVIDNGFILDQDQVPAEVPQEWEFSIRKEQIVQVSILWTETMDNVNKQGGLSNIEVHHSSTKITDDSDKMYGVYWEVDEGSGFYTFMRNRLERMAIIPLKIGVTKIRLKAVTREGNVGYSNILQYTREI